MYLHSTSNKYLGSVRASISKGSVHASLIVTRYAYKEYGLTNSWIVESLGESPSLLYCNKTVTTDKAPNLLLKRSLVMIYQSSPYNVNIKRM